MTFQARHQGIGGLVVDGSVRDSEEIRASGFPCFARFVSPIGTAKNTIGSVNVPIQCGGVVVNPGDLVAGDDDGVVVVPRRAISEVIEKARKRLEKEAKDREQFKLGKTSMDLNPSFQKVLIESGVKQVESLKDVV
jgi:4-hydroxy-4-methyl-2-oxoglutarate aldolase